MLTRLLSGLLGIFHAANGMVMLTAPRFWYGAAPGAAHSGPFNPHFIQDVGLAFLAAGLAFLAFASSVKWRLAAFGASGFIIFHALLHLSDLAGSDLGDLPAILAGIILPALLGLFLAWPRRGEAHA